MTAEQTYAVLQIVLSFICAIAGIYMVRRGNYNSNVSQKIIGAVAMLSASICMLTGIYKFSKAFDVDSKTVIILATVAGFIINTVLENWDSITRD